MSSLYNELLSELGKQASTEETLKSGVSSFDNDELVALAAELAELIGDKDLAAMAQVLPVYQSGGDINNDIQSEQLIQNVKVEELPVRHVDDEPLVTGPGGELTATASAASTKIEKAAEDKKKEDKKDDDKKEDKKDDEKKEERKEDKKDEKGETKKDEKDEEEDEDEKEASATETLYAILKQGAAMEEMIEKRATELAGMMVKEAEDADEARAIVEQGACHLDPNPVKQHDYAEHLMEKVRTVAAQADVTMTEAAQHVVNAVVSSLGHLAPVKTATAYESLNELSRYSSELEAEYEKVAAEVDEIASSIVRDAGMKQGLQDPQLHNFVMTTMDRVKTLAAQKDINLAQAAQELLAGGVASTTGIVELNPSPTQAPPQPKAPINSNQTQSPDAAFVQMVAPADPQVAGAAKVASDNLNAYIKKLVKEAMAEVIMEK